MPLARIFTSTWPGPGCGWGTSMLLTAPDLKLSPDRFVIDMMLSAMSGAMRSAFEAGTSPAMFRKMRDHLVLLCQSYMAAATNNGD